MDDVIMRGKRAVCDMPNEIRGMDEKPNKMAGNPFTRPPICNRPHLQGNGRGEREREGDRERERNRDREGREERGRERGKEGKDRGLPAMNTFYRPAKATELLLYLMLQ